MLRDLPICSIVFSRGTSAGSVFGFTFTPVAPQSAIRSMYFLVSSMFSFSLAGSGEWYSQLDPYPTSSTGESANRFFTSARSALLSDGSTL